MSELSLNLVYAIVFTLSLIIPAIIVTHVAKYKKSFGLSDNPTWPLAIFFIVWFALANYFGANYFGSVSQIKLASLLVLASTPLLIGVFIIVFSPSLKRLLTNIAPHWLIRLQAYRLLGFMFIYLYLKDDFLSKGFALSAGIGDVFIGLAALPVAWSLKNKVPGNKILAIVWNVAGIVDLIIAPASAIIFGNKGINFYPLILVPLFIGPPFSILLHVASLRNIFLQKSNVQFANSKSNF
jgi:hypothetical protein